MNLIEMIDQEIERLQAARKALSGLSNSFSGKSPAKATSTRGRGRSKAHKAPAKRMTPRKSSRATQKA